jgi:hypothetical protein
VVRRTGLALVALAVALSFAQTASTDDGSDWAALHRPLQLPALGPHGRCPVSRPAAEITGERYGVSSAFGPGPVYPILGYSPLLMAGFRAEEWGRGPWGGQKVLWFVHQRYTGPVLIRGRRLGGWEWMRFDRGSRPPAEIRIAPGETVTWSGQPAGSRGRPSYVRVRAPGCYAAQIDGTSFSVVVVFLVDLVR